MSPFLSKSKYLSGLQCSKLLWHFYNAKEEIPPPDASTQAIFDQGHVVGDFAKKLFPGGIEVAPGIVDYAEAVKRTQEVIGNGVPLFEAAFLADGCFARADILVPINVAPKRHSGQAASDLHSAAVSRNHSSPYQWDIIEVKSATQVKEVNLHDLAVQWHTYTGAGLSIRSASLMHIDNTYVRRGDIEPAKLFAREDVTDAVKLMLRDVPRNVRSMLTVIAQKRAPEVPIGPHCSSPYECPLQEKCWSYLPEHNPATLYRASTETKFELINAGHLDVKKLPKEFVPTEKQQIQIRSVKSGKPHIDRDAIREFLEALEYPLHFLDFETFNPAVPLFEGMRPYRQIPFQFSLHRQKKRGADVEHYSHLHEGRTDPRPGFLARLEECLGESGSIVTYNAQFEKSILNETVTSFPKYRKWNDAVQTRIVDLLVPFRAFSYYHPAQKGSASIKQVLPAITGKGYEGLEIADGGVASQEYMWVTFGDGITDNERSTVRKNLEQYCALDTEGMVWLTKNLRDLVGKSP